MVTNEELVAAQQKYALARANARAADSTYQRIYSALHEALRALRGAQAMRRVARAELTRLEKLRSAEKDRTKHRPEETPARVYLRAHDIDPNTVERTGSHGYWTWKRDRILWPATFDFPAFHELLLGDAHRDNCGECKQSVNSKTTTTTGGE